MTRQTCLEHSRYHMDCDGCTMARRAYQAERREDMGQRPREYARVEVPAPGSWVSQAACIGYPSDLFFKEVAGKGTDYSEAVAICKTCPVRLLCLDHALTVGEVHGCWGGMSPKDRMRMKRKRRNSA